ncbi:MAG: hypothetical protein HUU47_01015 [Bacteroidetes bacterium]|nr:hypothetical protein [Bacteroidota bacterium]
MILVIISFFTKALGQANVGIGTKTPATDALLDLVSKNMGFLTPRMTTAERLAIPASSNGLLVYDTDMGLFYYWNSTGSVWQALDDNTSTNELIQGITYDSVSNILKIWDSGNTYNINLKRNYYSQKLTFSNDTIFLSGGSFIKIPTSSDNQNLNITGGRIAIQRGNTIYLPDSSATNEIQTHSITGGHIVLSNGGGTVLLPDSSTNEIQTLSKTGNTITLSNGGGNVTVNDQDSTNEIQTISRTGGRIILNKNGGTATLPDSSATNELQVLSMSNDTIFLTNGGFVKLPSSLFWNLKGNSGTNPPSNLSIASNENFIGTTDSKDLVLGTNSFSSIKIDYLNKYTGFNTTSPNRSYVFVPGISGTWPASYDGIQLRHPTSSPAITSGLLIGIESSGTKARIFNQENDILSLGSYNSEVIRIAANGQVGIGHFSSNMQSTLALRDINGTGSGLLVTHPAYSLDSLGFRFALHGGSINGKIWNHLYGGDIYFGTNDAERMRLTSGGLLGLGNTNPFCKFDVYSNTNPVRFRKMSFGSITDSVLVDSSGIVRHISTSTLLNLTAWKITGNSGTTSSNFIGTTDNVPLYFKVNNTIAGKIDNANQILFFGHEAGKSITSGISNTFIGDDAGYSTTSGSNNTFLGTASGYNNTGSKNTFIGTSSGSSNTTGAENTVLGYLSGYNNTEGNYNTSIGTNSLFSNVAGSNSVAVGYKSMYYSNSSSSSYTNYNTAVGYESHRGSSSPSNNTGNYNSAMGYQSLWSVSTGSYNTSVGYQALYSDTSGVSNTAIGYFSLNKNTDGNENTSIGARSLNNNTNGGKNTSIGCSSMYENTTGTDNTSVGYSSLSKNTTGNYNCGFGSLSLSKNLDGEENTALGYSALRDNTTGSNNTSVGNYSLLHHKYGDENTALGNSALWADTSGENNTAIGYYALRNNKNGNKNTALGALSLRSNITGINNTAIGYYSLYANTSGENNIALGYSSMQLNTTGYSNIAIGIYALRNNTSKSNLIAIGDSALLKNTAGYENTSVGSKSSFNNTSGYQNTAFGYKAGYTNSTGNGNVFIGYEAGYNETGSNNLYISNSNTTTPLIKGDFSAGVVTLKSVLKLDPLASAPSGPSAGMIYYNSTDSKAYCYDGTTWKALW